MCTPSFGGDRGPERLARIAQPYGDAAWPGGHVAYDRANCLVFADTDNHRIRKVTAGIITTIAGTGVAGHDGENVPAIEAQLYSPFDLAVGPDNSIYFSDTENNCIRKIDPNGIITTVAGRCSSNPNDRGFSGDGGPPLEATFNRPYGIDLVGDKLYVSDSYNGRVRVVNLATR
jgi:serine/threonine-protein kinase